MVRGWSQRLHAFPTASNSRVGEEEKMSWGESLIEKMKYGLIIFLEGVKQDYLHNCNNWGTESKQASLVVSCYAHQTHRGRRVQLKLVDLLSSERSPQPPVALNTGYWGTRAFNHGR